MVIIGGGFSGLAAAYALVKKKIPVIVLEKEKDLGGVANSITLADGREIPVNYHHIVGTDRVLLSSLEELNLLPKVSWRRISLVANVGGRRVNLSSPVDIMTKLGRLSIASRIRYGLFGARCLLKSNWRDWEGKSIEKLISNWAGEAVLREIFEPLVDIKFGLLSAQVDAAWLGQRLHKREAATQFGYIPDASWPKEICASFKEEIEKAGGEIILQDELRAVKARGGELTQVLTKGGRVIKSLAILNTAPPPVIVPILKSSGLLPGRLKSLERIRYISSYSLIAGLPFDIFPDYWTIALHPRRIFGACFNLSRLNKTLVNKKDKCVINLFTNVAFDGFRYSENEYIKMAQKDLSNMIGRKVKFNWAIVNKLRYSSPIFDIDYKNPPIRETDNLFFAGIYRAFPKLASTGQAIQTGKEAAMKISNYLRKRGD